VKILQFQQIMIFKFVMNREFYCTCHEDQTHAIFQSLEVPRHGEHELRFAYYSVHVFIFSIQF